MSSSTDSTTLVKGKGPSSSVDRQLTLAIADFKKILTADQCQELEKLKGVPDADSVLVFTAELDSKVQTTRKSVAGKFYPALASMRDFCDLVDTFVSSKPEIAALVWGSLKLTIFMFTGSVSQIAALTDVFKFLQDASPRFAEYQALFPESSKLQEAVCNFHASVINCCSYLVKSMQLPWHYQLKQALWETFSQEINSHKDEIRQRSDLVRYELEIAKLQADRHEQLLQAEERKRSKLFRPTMEKSVDLQKLQLEKIERLDRAHRQSLIESLSNHDHILPWRQNHDKWQPGTLEWIFKSQVFNDWMDSSTSPLLWCSGKIGSGKTILSTKVIDHLLTSKQHQKSDILVTFFFICFDRSASLDTETVLRSLIRQTLDATSLDNDLVTQLENLSSDRFTDLEKLRGFLEKMMKQWRFIYAVIDGLDECSKPQCNSLLTALSKLSACHGGLRLLLTGRDSVSGDVRAIFPQISSISPYMEADMTKFINASVQARLDSKQLVVEDDGVIDEIKTALSDGADQMFIWVVFQLDEICLQFRSEDIRKAINNLPRDLKETFCRILHRIGCHDRSKVLRNALSWVAVAKEPLTKDQLRDALSVDIGQRSLQSQKNINDIDAVILRCENLLQVDEDFGIVQFAHSSILQFLQETDLPPPLSCYHINMADANHHAGEICVTYLNLNDFKTTLARRKKPSEHISPTLLAQVALRTAGMPLVESGVVLQKLGGLGKSKNPSKSAAVYPIASIATFGRADTNASESLHKRYPFLQYASRWWILHSGHFDKDKSQTWDAWHRMVTQGHELALFPWTTRSFGPFDIEILEWCARFDHVAITQCIATHQSLTETDRIDLAHFSAGEGQLRLFKSLEATLSEKGRLLVAQTYRAQETATQAFSSLVLISTESVKKIGSAATDNSSARTVTRSKLPSRFLGESTALHAAAWGGHPLVVESLLSMGGDARGFARIALPDGSGSGRLYITALQLAEINNHLDVVKRLLPSGTLATHRAEALAYEQRAGALIRRKKGTLIVYSLSPLQRAIYSGCSLEIVEFLLGKQAKFQRHFRLFGSPLQIAANRGDLHLVERLLETGANVNGIRLSQNDASVADYDPFLGDKPYQGENPFLRENLPLCHNRFATETPLALAARQGHHEIVDRLLVSKASLDIEGGLDSLILQVQREGHAEVAYALLAAKTMGTSFEKRRGFL